MKRFLAALFASMLLFAACGGGDEEVATSDTAAQTEGSQDEPTDGTSDADSPGTDDATDGGQSDDTSTSGSGGTATAAPKSTPAPVKQADEGTINRPRAGAYTYDTKGTAKSPQCADPNGCPFEAERTDDISYSDDVMTVKTTSDSDSGANTSRYRWESNRLLLLQIKTDTQAGSFGCTFEEPVTVAKFPLKVEDYGKQTFKGEGCEGSVTIKVLGEESVKDANGKTWKTWKMSIKTDFDFGSVSGTSDGLQWSSPDLGWEIRGEESAQGTASGFGPTPVEFSAESTSQLTGHP